MMIALRRWRQGAIAMALLLCALHGAPALATGDTAQDDIAREFSGALGANDNGANPTSPPSNCNATLQQEQSAGEIPANESCYCQVGAATPTCVVNTNNECQSVLQAEQSRMGSSYDCTCPSGANTPSCVSYYQLCEDNIQYYQNGTNQCSCSQGTTSAVPSCVSDYQICEDNAAQYENSNTTCSCSQTSTQPYCCTSTTTEEPTLVTNEVPGISAGVSSGVSVYCANPSRQIESTAYGPACPGSSGITTCYQGICRTWNNGNGSMYGGAFSGGGTHQVTGSYWDWGLCDGPNPAGSCGSSGGWFTIFFGPSSYAGPEVITYAPPYAEQITVYNPVTTQSCVTEP
ncbi:MAG: hypothetical protein ACYDCW_02025 [Acidithiobacillus ferrivorans]